MPRNKGSRSPRTKKKTSVGLPAGRRTSGSHPEEFIFSEWTDSFFTDGKVKSLQGTSNVLLVAPNMSPNAADKNIGLLTCWLAEALGGYAVVNCGLYRRPVEGDPTPEEVQPSPSPNPGKEEKKILQLRQSLWDETGGIPVNLDSFNSASLAAYEYVEAIWLSARDIGRHDIPLVFFMEGINDDEADKYMLDISLKSRYAFVDHEQGYTMDTALAEGALLKQLIRGLKGLGEDIRVSDSGLGFNLAEDKSIAGYLRHDWNDPDDHSAADGSMADDIYRVELAIRYTGFRDNKDNMRRTVRELAHAISGLRPFKSWQEGEMAKPDEKKPKKSNAKKKTPSAPKEATAAEEQSSTEEGNAMTKQPAESAQAGVSLISQEKFQEKVTALKGLTTIRNDKDLDIAFEGEAKDVFINAFEAAYPVVERALGSIHELGTFLLDVRKKLKPHRLYYAWLEYAGIPERTAANYVQVCEKYSDKLPQFAHLGIRKLLTASRLKDCVDYVEKNVEAIEDQPVAELEQAVKALRSAKKTSGTGRGPKPTYIEVGKCKLRPSKDGTRLVVEGLTMKKQDELIQAIKGLLS